MFSYYWILGAGSDECLLIEETLEQSQPFAFWSTQVQGSLSALVAQCIPDIGSHCPIHLLWFMLYTHSTGIQNLPYLTQLAGVLLAFTPILPTASTSEHPHGQIKIKIKKGKERHSSMIFKRA